MFLCRDMCGLDNMMDSMQVEIERLISVGAFTVVDANGEQMLHMVPDVLKRENIDLYYELINEMDEVLLHLVDLGFVQMQFDADPETGITEPLYSLTELGRQYVEQALR